MDSIVGGGSKREEGVRGSLCRDQRKAGDWGRPLTSDYTEPPLSPCFSPPQGMGTRVQHDGSVCIYILYVCVCVCESSLPASAYCALKHKKMISGILCGLNSMPLRLRQLVKDVRDEMVLGFPRSHSTWRKRHKTKTVSGPHKRWLSYSCAALHISVQSGQLTQVGPVFLLWRTECRRRLPPVCRLDKHIDFKLNTLSQAYIKTRGESAHSLKAHINPANNIYLFLYAICL